jgi:hypothetical protein
MVRVTILLLLLFAALGYAFWRGGAPERAMALVWLALLVIDPILHLVVPLDYLSVDRGHLLIDVSGSIGSFLIALFAYRHWPLLVAPLQFLPLLAHISRAVHFDMHPSAYLIMQVASYWLLTPILILGTWRHHRRTRLYGFEPDWVVGTPWHSAKMGSDR